MEKTIMEKTRNVEKTKNLGISVVICTKNRPNHLKACLTSLLKQTYPPKAIIIVDDYSDEDLNVYEFLMDEIATFHYSILELLHNVDITLIKNKVHSGIVASRNTGISVAGGDIVAFLDDDGFAHKDWLKNLAKSYGKNEKILGVGGPVVEIGRSIKTPTRPIKNLAYIKDGKIVTNYRVKRLEEIKYLPRKFVPFLQGGNMSFRRNALLQVGGGNANLAGNFYREETDLCIRISRKGRLLFEPSAVTYHNTAKSGGCRDIINFDLSRFLYFMFRNTTYFFFENFGLKKAIRFTFQALRRQIRLIQKNKTGIPRDYLLIINKKQHIKSAILGSLAGFLKWLRPRKSQQLVCSESASVNYFKLIFVANTLEIIKIDDKASLIRGFLGV